MSMDPMGDPVWFIKVKETVYGPYNEARLRTFASEGRLNRRSMVSQNKDGPFQSAGEDDFFASFLPLTSPDKTVQSTPAQARRFVVFARISEISRPAFIETLSGFGIAIEAMPDVWLLSAHASAATLRNAMSQVLEAEDSLFIADATKGSSAWFNVGQDTDNRIRQFWQESE
ncbi:MAG: GYF domain-containing protein [Robiginitomaculum sp.]|nr:GYF domain-containing protein [Robiginitomaculum sp.]MDQ7078965.1 GYF domain-containing protein [Robiginitomaculum sp.]